MAIEDFFVDDDKEENGDQRIFEVGDLRFVKLFDQEPLQFEVLKGYDGIIIEYSRHTFTFDMIRSIRSHEEEEVYLMPLYLYKSYGEYSELLKELVDGTLERLSELGGIAETTSLIKNRL
ncbi:hypothetical protein AB2B38_010735 [Balneola sp. MJW-20]|uniref:hypothetical protein n=1 Tax=Gracilimonas aurantiaca TaxID=3234185 RepID=UPI003465974F